MLKNSMSFFSLGLEEINNKHLTDVFKPENHVFALLELFGTLYTSTFMLFSIQHLVGFLFYSKLNMSLT